MTKHLAFLSGCRLLLYIPEAKMATSNAGVDNAERIITDGAPDSTVEDLQTTFTRCYAADKSHICNSHERRIP